MLSGAVLSEAMLIGAEIRWGCPADTTQPDGSIGFDSRVTGAINVARAFPAGRVDRGRDDRRQRGGHVRRGGVGQRR